MDEHATSPRVHGCGRHSFFRMKVGLSVRETALETQHTLCEVFRIVVRALCRWQSIVWQCVCIFFVYVYVYMCVFPCFPLFFFLFFFVCWCSFLFVFVLCFFVDISVSCCFCFVLSFSSFLVFHPDSLCFFCVCVFVSLCHVGRNDCIFQLPT